MFTPAILGLMVFFILLSLSGSGISNFSVVALMSADGLAFSTANLALTAFLTASAFGVLGGGFVADRTRRHGQVAAAGFAGNAVIMLVDRHGRVRAPVPLVGAMGVAGFLSGMIMPSRDMLVRAAAPAGAVGRRVRYRLDRLQHRRHGRADTVWLDHGSWCAALGVWRYRRVHDVDRSLRADRGPAIAARRRR